MFGSESISPSQSRTSNITGNKIKLETQCKGSYQTPLYAEKSGSVPLSNILKNTALLRRSDFHLSPDNPFLQVDSRPPPGTVFTSEDLCTGRKRRRRINKDKENSPLHSIRNNQATIVHKKNLEPRYKGSSQTPCNAKNSVSTPLSNILKNTTLLRRSSFHQSLGNRFLQVDSLSPPGTVFTSEDLCTGLQADSRPLPGTVFTSEDLCTGRKHKRGNNKDKEDIRPQSIRINQAALENKKNLEPPYRGSYQTPYNAKNSVSGSDSDSHAIPPSTGVFSSGSSPLSNILKNTALLRRTDFHLSPDNSLLKVDSRSSPETVFTSEDLCTGRGANKDKENTPSQSIRYNKASINGRGLTQKPRPPRVNGVVSMHINQLPTRIPLSNISNIDVSTGIPQKSGKLKKKNFLAEVTLTLFEETEVCNGEDRDNERSDQSRIAKVDSNDKTSSSAEWGTRVAVKPEYSIILPGSTTNPAVHKYAASGPSVEAVPLPVANSGDDSAKAKEFANNYSLSSEMGFSSNSVVEALLMHDNDPDKV